MDYDFTDATFVQVKVMLAVMGGSFGICEALEDQNGLVWIVPEWLESPSEGLMYPKRVILMNSMPFETLEGYDHRYALNVAIPKAVWDGDQPPLLAGFVVIERPKIALTSGRGIH